MDYLKTVSKHIQERIRGAHEPEHARFLALTFWRMLVIATFVGATLSITLGILETNSVSAILDEGLQSAPNTRTLLNRAQLDAVVQGFVDRAAAYDQLKTQVPLVADPSQ